MEEYKLRLESYVKANGQPLSKQSQQLYFRNVDNLIKKHGLNWKLKDITSYFKDYSTPHQLNILNAIINFLTIMDYNKQQILPYQKFRDELRTVLEKQPQIAPKKQENLSEWGEVLKWRDIVSAKNTLTLQGKGNIPISNLQTELLLHIYTSYPRRNEIADLRYTTDLLSLDENNQEFVNHLIHDVNNNKYYFKFGDYKTNKTYGIQIYPITQENIINLLNIFLEKNNYQEVMFISPKSKEPLSRLNLTKLLQRSSKKHINKSLSTNMIRHAYASQNKDIKNKLEHDADLMAHSVKTHLNVYTV